MYRQYRKKGISEMREISENEVFTSDISISEADRLNGSPMMGDMIARNPKDHSDQWLVAKKYFEDNYELVE